MITLGASYGAIQALGASSAPSAGTAPSLGTTVGPVPLSISQEPAKRIEPEQFGAQGNGTTNDTAAVQHAINAAHGRTVWLGANKTYRITKQLNIPSYTTIEGDGSTSVLKFTWFDGAGTKSGGKFYLANDRDGRGSANIALSNFVIQGAGSGQPSGPNNLYPNKLACGVRLTAVDNFSFTHLEIQGTPGYALGEFGSKHGLIEYNYIPNSGRGGIGLWWDANNTDQVTISHNTIHDAGDDAIAVNGIPDPPMPQNHASLPSSIHITRNSIVGWPTNVNGRALGNGIALYAVANVLVKNNSIKNTYAAGILLDSCGHSRCPDGPAIRDPSTNQRWRSNHIKLLSNHIVSAGKLHRGTTLHQRGVPTSGIVINTAAETTVRRNKIRSPAHKRIVSSACHKCTIQ